MAVDDVLAQKAVDCDWVLQTLIHSANYGLEIGLTLTTGAGIITGTLIGGAKYMDMQKAALEPHWGSEELRQSFSDVFADWRKRYVPTDEDAADPSAPIYIHLKDARVFVGDRFVPSSSDGMLWRGKLDSIVGFTIGTISINR